ncbi:MAG: hypothetical protein JXB85_11190, partial [Anaerolineales bacterium]|nr:hypothetical protein [Anaerolineales bacterium]
MTNLKRTLAELFRYPSAIAGMVILLIMIGVSIYALSAIPYDEAIRLWRGGEEVWYMNPKTVPPEWTNWFRSTDLPASFILDSAAPGEADHGTIDKSVEELSSSNIVTMIYTFDYNYDAFPQEMILFFDPVYTETPPFVSMTWITPDGREIRMNNFSVQLGQSYYFSQDVSLQRRLHGMFPQEGLFADPDAETPTPLAGTYVLRIEAVLFDDESDLDAEFVVYGLVAGWAGTDHLRRDLGVALLWGTPVALAFGLLAALGANLATMFISAFGVWYGGWVDELIQRITEVNLVLPFLPILIMIGTF